MNQSTLDGRHTSLEPTQHRIAAFASVVALFSQIPSLGRSRSLRRRCYSMQRWANATLQTCIET